MSSVICHYCQRPIAHSSPPRVRGEPVHGRCVRPARYRLLYNFRGGSA